MKSLEISELTGPEGIAVVDKPDPEASHFMSPGVGVVIDVKAAAVSFPDVLQSRGLYQFKPPLPFVPGAEVAGEVVSASADSGFEPGQRVAAVTMLGGMAERAVAPPAMTFALQEQLDFGEGAALIMNYHTVYFSLKLRAGMQEGESVLVHGAAGGVGTAGLQVAKALGASRTVAVVSSDEKEKVARDAGADEVLRSDSAWKDQVKEMGGVDIVLDPVGGDRFTDSLRSLREDGRLIVVGFTGGAIPEIKVNRLLLNNTSVVGAGWGAYVSSKPDLTRRIGEALDGMIESGAVKPIVGARFPLERAADAMNLIDGRGALGKVVLDVPG